MRCSYATGAALRHQLSYVTHLISLSPGTHIIEAMGYQSREDRAKDQRRRENRGLRDEHGGNERQSQHAARDRHSVNADAALMRCLKDAIAHDPDPTKSQFIDWLRGKRWGQFFTPAHFHAALSAITPTGHLGEIAVEPWVHAGERLAENFLKCSQKPKPFENAGILFSLTRVGVNNKPCIEKCLEHAREDLPACDVHDASLYLYTLDRLALTRPHHRDLVREISVRLSELLEYEECYSRKLVSCVHHLSRYRVHHAHIISTVAGLIMNEPENVSLVVLGIFARATTKVNWSSQDFLKYLGNKTLQGIVEGRGGFLESGSASGLAAMIRALEAHDHPIPERLLNMFSARCGACWDSYSIMDQTLIAGQFAPVLLGRGIQPPAAMAQLLYNQDSLEGVLRYQTETIEEIVGARLSAMSLNFEHGVVRHSFEMDFLVRVPGRPPIDLEIDGVHCHTIEVLDGKLAPWDEVPRSQAFRDRVLQRLGYDIVRLSVTDWLAAPADQKADLLRRRLKID
jgi:hypothetical protein